MKGYGEKKPQRQTISKFLFYTLIALLIILTLNIIMRSIRLYKYEKIVYQIEDCYEELYADLGDTLHGEEVEFWEINDYLGEFRDKYEEWFPQFRKMYRCGDFPQEIERIDNLDTHIDEAYQELITLFYDCVDEIYIDKGNDTTEMIKRLENIGEVFAQIGFET